MEGKEKDGIVKIESQKTKSKCRKKEIAGVF